MSNELALIERQLTPLAPMFEQLLRPTGVPADRIIRSVLISCERVPRLLECTPMSVIQGATSFAVLGLEADGFTGQAYLLPFRDRGTMKAQPVVGYRGFNTIGARVGLTITGDVVREGDSFDYEKGTDAFVRHRPQLGGGERRIIGAWAVAAANGRPPIVEVMDVDEINAVRDRSPAMRSSADTPWKDPKIGYPAMAAKTVKRRLARALPLSVYQLAARMDEAHDEQGRHAYIHPEKGLVIDGEAQPIGEHNPAPDLSSLDRPRFVIVGSRGRREYDSIESWRAAIVEVIEGMRLPRAIEGLRELNQALMDEYRSAHRDHVEAVEAVFARRLASSHPHATEGRPVVEGSVSSLASQRGATLSPSPGNGAPVSEVPFDVTRGHQDANARHAPSGAPSDERKEVMPADATDRADRQVDATPPVASEPQGARSRDSWFDGDLVIPVPTRGGKEDWPAWPRLFFEKADRAADGVDLARMIGANDERIQSCKAACGPIEARHFDEMVKSLYARLP